MTGSAQTAQQPMRCAIYTRKSSEAGLEQSFNSLHAQREACEAYIKSQAHDHWKLRPTAYDDGGLSGGNMDRPALHQLISDIRNGLIDVVVVYKVDRLSRSLADFARLIELFEEHQVSFVSVTQHFNTSSSMGRLTLNVLLSFAQFEREVTGERIRDKIAASKKKGMWMGGRVPIGYDAVDKQLVVNAEEAVTVRHIYERYLALGCVRRLKRELDVAGYVSKVRGNGEGGKSFSRGALYTLLRNPVYVGNVGHKGKTYPGQHHSIVDQDLWDQVQNQLKRNRSKAKRRSAAKAPSLLAGLLFDSNGHPMSPTHATKGQKRYRYYISQAILKYVEGDGGSMVRVPAGNVESVVIDQLKDFLHNSRTLLQAFQQLDLPAYQLDRLLSGAREIADSWGHLTQQKKISHLNSMVAMVVLAKDSIETHLNINGVLITSDPGLAELIDESTIFDTEHLITTPVQLKRSGVETKLIVTGGVDLPAHAESVKAIQSALQKAHRWNQSLLEGKAKTLTELAKREGVDQRYLFDLIKLSFLAPDIQNSIVKGTIPSALTLDKLKKEIATTWREQRKQLHFSV